jgi:membrane associated rhomboid family serine protease
MAYGSSFSFGYSLTPWIKRLLIANTAIFLLTYAIPAIQYYLAFTPAEILSRPWTPITYMFAHGGLFHLLFNMLALFFFGARLESQWGSREFIKYYVICGLGGAALSFVFAFSHPVVGASGAVYGLMLAYAMNWPDDIVHIWGIFPVKVKWLVVGLVAISLLSIRSGSGGTIAHFAHLGGFAAGFLYLKLDDPMTDRITRLRKLMSRPRLTVIAGDQPASTPVRRPDARPGRRRNEEQLLDDVDRVLDKISASGMSSLTPEERKLLDEVSKRYRKN